MGFFRLPISFMEKGKTTMQNLVKALIGLAALALILGGIQAVCSLQIMGLAAESFSRASNNLALIAIALSVCAKGGTTAAD